MQPRATDTGAAIASPPPTPVNRPQVQLVCVATGILVLSAAAILFSGLPKMDASANALQPRDSQAYATLDRVKQNLGQKRDPLWLVVSGTNEAEVAQKLRSVLPALQAADFKRLTAPPPGGWPANWRPCAPRPGRTAFPRRRSA
jgi:hypothetical protein